MNTEQQISTEEKPWFYKKNGLPIGGISETGMIELINNKTLSHSTSVWKKSFSDWMKIESTELHIHLDNIAPPPLTGKHVSNTIVWVLAFAPLIGLALEYVLAGAIYFDNAYLAEKTAADGDYWYVTLVLTLMLSYWDAKRLKEIGTNTTAFNMWALLVPIYLYQRAKILKQNLTYFSVWMMCFILALILM